MFKYLKKQQKKRNAKSPSLKKVKVITSDTAFIYLESPHITEKATFLAELNQYIFKVKNNSNKIQIKEAVESLYDIDVVNVNIIRIPAKKKRIGRIQGKKPGYKKAIIKVKEGQKIEFI